MTAPESPYWYSRVRPRRFPYTAYLKSVADVVAALTRILTAIAEPYQRRQLTRVEWLAFLAATYPYVVSAREQVSELARDYYDYERENRLDIGPIQVPLLEPPTLLGPDGREIDFQDTTTLQVDAYERVKINLPSYEPDWFEESMEAEILPFTKPNTTDAQVAKVVGVAQKEVEKAGRRTTIWAVEKDPRVLGWARVEGNENIGSCGFCAMLISRGPVYKDAQDAGLDVSSNASAAEIFRQAEASGDDSKLMGLMARWHPNCDCKVVPVFKRNDWQGKDQYDAMLELWYDVTSEHTGRDKLNAFRRALERGDLPEGIRRPRAA